MSLEIPKKFSIQFIRFLWSFFTAGMSRSNGMNWEPPDASDVDIFSRVLTSFVPR
jgi:hypothetical protein